MLELGKQLLIATETGFAVVLGLSQDGACIDLFEIHSETCLKGDLSKDTTVNLPFFSLVNTYKI
jgi:hypothetical protein